MSHLLWRIITERQNRLEQANNLVDELVFVLPQTEIQKVGVYYKFPASFSIELRTSLSAVSASAAAFEILTLASKIASPWTIHFQDGVQDFEMLLNVSKETRFSKEIFYAIRWMHIMTVPFEKKKDQ